MHYGNLVGRFTASGILKSLACLMHWFPEMKSPLSFHIALRHGRLPWRDIQGQCNWQYFFPGMIIRIWWGLSVQPFVLRFPRQGLGSLLPFLRTPGTRLVVDNSLWSCSHIISREGLPAACLMDLVCWNKLLQWFLSNHVGGLSFLLLSPGVRVARFKVVVVWKVTYKIPNTISWSFPMLFLSANILLSVPISLGPGVVQMP